MEQNLYYFSASARLPQDFPSGEVYKFVDVGFVVDLDTLEVIDGGITLLTRVATDFLLGLIIGTNLSKDGVLQLEKQLRKRYHGSALKAIIVAIRQIAEKVQNLASNKETE